MTVVKFNDETSLIFDVFEFLNHEEPMMAVMISGCVSRSSIQISRSAVDLFHTVQASIDLDIVYSV